MRKTINHNPQRFFMVAPQDIYEHPTNLPTKKKDIPNGPIEGWLCFAPNFRGHDREMLGPFTAVVKRPFNDERVCIEAFHSEYNRYEFWYEEVDDPKNEKLALPNRNCWHQSSCTLRFIKERKYKHHRVKHSGNQYALISAFAIEVLGMKAAFEDEAKLPFSHFIGYDTQELYDQHGKPWVEDGPSKEKKEQIIAFIIRSLRGQDMTEWSAFLSTLTTEENEWAMGQLSRMLHAATSHR